MNNFIPENLYRKFLDNMPIFCIDFLYKCNQEYLLLKRVDEPLKDIYWLPGGRLRLNEKIEDCAFRIQTRETGRYIKEYKLVGFSNYLFNLTKDGRAIHTPTLLFQIELSNQFIPLLDNTHSDYIWTKKLPEEFIINLIKFKDN